MIGSKILASIFGLMYTEQEKIALGKRYFKRLYFVNNILSTFWENLDASGNAYPKLDQATLDAAKGAFRDMFKEAQPNVGGTEMVLEPSITLWEDYHDADVNLQQEWDGEGIIAICEYDKNSKQYRLALYPVNEITSLFFILIQSNLDKTYYNLISKCLVDYYKQNSEAGNELFLDLYNAVLAWQLKRGKLHQKINTVHSAILGLELVLAFGGGALALLISLTKTNIFAPDVELPPEAIVAIAFLVCAVLVPFVTAKLRIQDNIEAWTKGEAGGNIKAKEFFGHLVGFIAMFGAIASTAILVTELVMNTLDNTIDAKVTFQEFDPIIVGAILAAALAAALIAAGIVTAKSEIKDFSLPS